MITFKRIYESLFHSFRTLGGTMFLDELTTENIQKVVVIQRSWIYGFFVSLLLPIIMGISGADAWYILTSPASIPRILLLSFGGIMLMNMIGLSLAGVIFLRYYRKSHKKLFEINQASDLSTVRSNINMSDRVFAHFFSQITGAYFISIITLLILIWITLVSGSTFVFTGLILTFLTLVQCILIVYYRRKMIDLQMDYIFVVPGKVYFIDQKWVSERTEAMRLYSNLRLVVSSFPNWFGSFMNYGSIEIVAKNDFTTTMNSFNMHYIDRPVETVRQINQFIDKKGE